jgi:regulator of cell morphogenesis and NO signaling
MPVAVIETATCSLAELTQYIRDTHHAYLRHELPALWECLKEAAAAQGRQSVEAEAVRSAARLFGRFRSTLDNHLLKEEAVLFPFIERLERSIGIGEPVPAHAFGPLRLPIEILEGEHMLADRLLHGLRPLWTRWQAEADPSPAQSAFRERMLVLEADMSRHTHLEDHILFPRTITLEER